MSNEIPTYQEHAGTIRVAGKTLPSDLGAYAFMRLLEGASPLEFLVIGANANHQAMKGMSVFLHLYAEENTDKKLDVAFQPLRYRVNTKDPATGVEMFKDACIWRVVLFKKE